MTFSIRVSALARAFLREINGFRKCGPSSPRRWSNSKAFSIVAGIAAATLNVSPAAAGCGTNTSNVIKSAPATVTFSSSAQNITLQASVTSNGVTVGPGTCGRVSGTAVLTIPGTSVTFTVRNSSNVVVGTAQTDTVPSSGIFEVTYALPADTAAGNYTISAQYTGGGAGAGANGSSVGSGSFPINQANQAPLVVSATPSSIVTGQTSALGTSGGSGGGAVTYAVTAGTGFCSVSGSTLTGTSIGSCTVTATKAASGNYLQQTGSVDVAVNIANTTTSLNVSPNPNPFGNPTTLTATVAPVAPGGGTPTGTVQFYINGEPEPGWTATLSGGVATYVVPEIEYHPPGYNISAVYAGNSEYSGSTSSTVNLFVQKSNTTTSVVSSLTPSDFGVSVTFTATVTPTPPGAGTPLGFVQFNDNGNPIGIPVQLIGGQASRSTTTLTPGAHTITVRYIGSNEHNGSTSPALTQDINKIPTSTVVSSTPNPSVHGESVTLSATVSGAGGTPTGTVQFFIDDNPAGAGVLNGSGIATLATSAMTTGSHAITAQYQGDVNYVTSTSAASAHNVNKADTTTSLNVSPNPNPFGNPTTLTATVAPVAPGGGTSTGTVQFYINGAPEPGWTATLSGGVATYVVPEIEYHPPGYNISAVYSGSGDHNGSTSSTVNLFVQKSDTTTAVVSSLNPSDFGASVTFTATVTPTPPGAGVPLGFIQFYDNAIAIGIPVQLIGGQASRSTTTLTPGAHTITARYIGSNEHNGSTSPDLTQTINKLPASTTLVSSLNPSTFGDAVTFTATVTGASGTPTGSAQFFVDGNPGGTVALNASGVATFLTSTLNAGTHSVTVQYSGDTIYLTSTSTPVSQDVGKADQAALTAIATPPSIAFGETSALSTAGGSGTGAVTFAVTSGGTFCALSGPDELSGIGAGACTVTATKAADANYNEATATVGVTVGKAGQTISFTNPGAQTYSPGGLVPLTATATSGLTVAFASTTPAVCDVAGTDAVILAAGDCTIEATQPGNANYNAATPASETFSIGKADQAALTAIATPPSIAFGETSALSTAGGSGTGAVTFAVTSGGTFCALSGPDELSGIGAGACTVTATKAADANYNEATATVGVTVGAPDIAVAPASLPGGVAGTSYNQTVTASGGTPAYTFTVSGSLPPGLSLTSAGSISGTPTSAGPFSFSITASDATAAVNGGPFTGTRNYTITIDAPTIAIAPASLPPATGGTAYSQTINANGGTAPYAFSVSSGSLPAGLTLSPAGIISGTPTAAGPATFAVTATDDLGFTAAKTYTINVGAPEIALQPESLPPGDQGVSYAQTIVAAGGTAPYTFTVNSGTLPPGLALNPSSGTLNGTPAANGSFTFAITASDTYGFTGVKSYTVAVGTAFIEKRTAEVIKNFVAHRADVLTSDDADRTKNFRRFSGSLFGGSSSNGQTAGYAGNSRAPVDVAVTADDDGDAGRVAFATSLQQMLAYARKEKSAASASGAEAAPAGRMALGAVNTANDTTIVTPAFDFWVEGRSTHFDDDGVGSSGNVGVMYVGADYLVHPGMLVGMLVQFDFADEKSSLLGSNVKGHGWMAGPYIAARLTDNLFFDARAAWGQSDNTISPFGTYADNFETERWLARANLTGNWEFGPWRFSPTAGVAYFDEDVASYVDSNGIFIAGQSVKLGRLNFGPELGYKFRLQDGSVVEPSLSLQGIWDFERENPATLDGIEPGTDDLRAKVEIGASFISPSGYTLRAAGSVDGLGSDDYKAYGGKLYVNMPLN